MEKLIRKKPYKAKPPYETINYIRNILEKLDLFTIEVFHNQVNDSLFSCRVNLNDEVFYPFDIGTNGKGLTSKYALASAYAELMERLQNSFLFSNWKYATKKYIKRVNNKFIEKLKKNDLILDFIEDPNEKFISINELINNNFNILKNLTNITDRDLLIKYFNSLNVKELLCTPFYNIQNENIIFLPIDLVNYVCGSNGLCAGNTKEEAIVQGICEIFERYAIKRIYYDNITPPTIPHEYFEGTLIFEKLRFIEKEYNFNLIIKDCSLGIGLPVLGLLVIDKKNNKYAFNLGSDPSPINTLERCLTEIYQGDINIKFRKMHLNDNIDTEEIKHINFYKTFTNGSGHWPNSIFYPEESYVFKGFNFPVGNNDREDLNNILDKVNELNFNIYIRDVSYFNFPSFRVYIPGMSESYFEILKEQLAFDNGGQEILFDIKNSTNDKLTFLATILEHTYKNTVPYKSKITNLFLYNNNSDLSDTEIELFLSMLFYKIEDYESSYKYIKRFCNNISKNEKGQFIYYFCIRDYLKLKTENKSDEFILNSLSIMYDVGLVTGIYNDLKDPNKIFKYFNLPSCFNCEECEINKNCLYFKFLRKIKKLQIHINNNPIDQNNLKKIFTSVNKIELV